MNNKGEAGEKKSGDENNLISLTYSITHTQNEYFIRDLMVSDLYGNHVAGVAVSMWNDARLGIAVSLPIYS